jgi:uncharacterized protein YdeI (YjbR/CyaY-like superfamily)
VSEVAASVSPEMNTYLGLEVREFPDRAALRAWLSDHHSSSAGIWVRVYKAQSGHASVSFEELLDQGLCFGWSESLRHPGDRDFYLQRFTPRRARGTTSKRNLDHAEALIASGEMTAAGLAALGLNTPTGAY